MRLFRAISISERLAIQVFGILTIGSNSCEGKHFATTFDHARQWGERNEPAGFVLIEVDVSAEHFRDFYLISDHLDMIGPAYFADETQLTYCEVVKVYE